MRVQLAKKKEQPSSRNTFSLHCKCVKRCKKKRKIVAGGPMSGAIGIVMMVEAGAALELDELIESLPVWPVMETSVTPLTTFDGRMVALRPRVELWKTSLKKEASAIR
jgi:muconolactone delta-isomerase